MLHCCIQTVCNRPNFQQNLQRSNANSKAKTDRRAAAPTRFNFTAHARARRGASRAYTTSLKRAHRPFRTQDNTSDQEGLGLSPFPVPGRCGGRWNTGPALPATPPSPATGSRTSRRSRTWPRGKCVRQPFRGRGPLILPPTVF